MTSHHQSDPSLYTVPATTLQPKLTKKTFAILDGRPSRLLARLGLRVKSCTRRLVNGQVTPYELLKMRVHLLVLFFLLQRQFEHRRLCWFDWVRERVGTFDQAGFGRQRGHGRGGRRLRRGIVVDGVAAAGTAVTF